MSPMSTIPIPMSTLCAFIPINDYYVHLIEGKYKNVFEEVIFAVLDEDDVTNTMTFSGSILFHQNSITIQQK